MPQRIQLRRTKGWKMPANTVSVARPGRWGNPFVVGSECQVDLCSADGLWNQIPGIIVTVELAVALFRAEWESKLTHTPTGSPSLDEEDVQYVASNRAAIETLRGKNLACYCKPSDCCHADVLLELANR